MGNNKMNSKVIITAALAGAATFKNNNPAVPYTPDEFANEAHIAYKAGAAMVHVHGRRDDGFATYEIERIRQIHDAIKQRTPELIVNLSSAASPDATPEQRIAQIIAIKPEMASLNTNTMNFSIMNRKTGQIVFDNVFTNTFTMLQDFGKAMEEHGIKPEIEIYDIGGIDNTLLIMKQGFFSSPMNFNFVWGTAGGQAFRASSFETMVHALPDGSNFTACGIGREQFPAVTQSCILGGHMRVGLEDNVHMPDGALAKGNWALVEVAVKIAECLGREITTPNEARKIMGIKT
jgi:3-keto-5-aminohexanoate cleavage enzyme